MSGGRRGGGESGGNLDPPTPGQRAGIIRTFLSRTSANAGASLAAGGTLLAIGVALGAIGLTEVTIAKTPASPFKNGWVLVGFVMMPANDALAPGPSAGCRHPGLL